MLYVISGKKRSGKDTIAKFITENIDRSDKFALAEPIKEALVYGFAWSKFLHNREITIADMNGFGIDREEDLELENNTVKVILKEAWSWVVKRKPEFYTNEVLESVMERVETICESDIEPWTIRRLMQVFGTDLGVYIDESIWLKFFADVYISSICDNIDLVVTDCRQEHEMKVLRALGAKFIFVHKPESEQSADSHSTEKGLTPEEHDIVIYNEGSVGDLKNKVLKVIQ